MMRGLKASSILFLSTIIIMSFLPIGGGLPVQQVTNEWSETSQLSTLDREVHDPILIVGNDDFTAANGVTGGSGTEEDPYIIEGWEISASTAHGIHIVNTTAYFIVRNCLVENGRSTYFSGICLDSVQNGRIENTITRNNYHGIPLYGADFNEFIGNTISKNYFGISFDEFSDNNILIGSTIKKNFRGIYLEYPENNLMYNNYFSNRHNATDYGTNIWNIHPVHGPNIVGGPLLGGNYWSDYEGEDLDNDGLGDTLLPYNSSGGIVNGGDYHPLVPYVPPPPVEKFDL